MNETIKFRYDGKYHEVQLTENVRQTLNSYGARIPSKSEKELVARVEELLYDIAEVKPRNAGSKIEVEVSDGCGRASLDYGQPQALDEADDVEIRMIREDRITVGWSEEDE